MNLADIAVVASLITGIGAPSGIALKYYADHEYVLVADSLKGQLYEIQDEIFEMEQDAKYGEEPTIREEEALDRLRKREQDLLFEID